MHTFTDILAVLPTLARRAMKSYAYRVVDYKYLANTAPLHPNRFLYGLGAPTSGARFTPKGGPAAIYIAEDMSTAFDEANPVQAIIRLIDPGLAAPTPPGGHASILYQLETVLDVTDATIQNALGTTTAELTGHWRQSQKRGHVSPTQTLGQAVYDSGLFQAIWYESARVPGTYCLAVFIDRLVAPSYIEVFDPNNNFNERIP